MQRPFCFGILIFVYIIRIAVCDEPQTIADQPGQRATNQITVSPQGPRDGGDFGPHTPGTKTSGLREALLAAKEHARDVYLADGSRNYLTLSTRPFPNGPDLILEPTAEGNLILFHSPYRVEDRSHAGANPIIGVQAAKFPK